MKKLPTNLFLYCLLTFGAYAQKRPNVVLIFPDNLGIGEVASYGGVRGVPTPNIDQIGKEGIRLTNFNVEYSCTPSRACIMTGRYATRTGETYGEGLTHWEVTIAEGLRSVGYATALFGKWDLGGDDDWLGKREPTQQGFDEWYGIPSTSQGRNLVLSMVLVIPKCLCHTFGKELWAKLLKKSSRLICKQGGHSIVKLQNVLFVLWKPMCKKTSHFFYIIR